jgi:TonB family protein
MLRLIAAFLITGAVCTAQPVSTRFNRVYEMPESRAIPEQDVAAKLQQDPNNISLLLSMATMKLADAGPLRDQDERAAAFDEAQSYFERVVSLDSQNITALYNLGVIGWMRVFPALQTARAQLAMDPETPGPLRDRGVRTVLNGKYARALNDSVADLERVLAIDPQSNESMAYLNLVYRAKADLEDTVEASKADTATADRWVQKALQTAQEKEAAGIPINPAFAQAPPPPPPPPPPVNPGALISISPGGTPMRIRVGGKVQEANLIQRVDPVYPPLALEARIQGTVRFNVTISKDGTIANLQVVSGHPMLVQSALEAAKQWVYKPTLLNGAPVEVTTTLDVSFALP